MNLESSAASFGGNTAIDRRHRDRHSKFETGGRVGNDLVDPGFDRLWCRIGRIIGLRRAAAPVIELTKAERPPSNRNLLGATNLFAEAQSASRSDSIAASTTAVAISGAGDVQKESSSFA